MFGKAYVIDHCIGFFRRKNERLLYEVYVTDALKAIAENTARMYGGSSMKTRYAELVQERKGMDDGGEVKAERTANEIISNIKDKINKLGG